MNDNQLSSEDLDSLLAYFDILATIDEQSNKNIRHQHEN